MWTNPLSPRPHGMTDPPVRPNKVRYYYYYYYYYNRFTVPWTVSGTNWVSQYQKGKTRLDLLEQEIVMAVASAGPYANLHRDPDT